VELLEASTTVEDLVAAALAQRREVIASIVHARVEALIDEIIEAELAGRANGGSDTAAETAPQRHQRHAQTLERIAQRPNATVKRCSSCSETKALDQFPPGRNQCKRCRNRAGEEAKRRRRQAPEAPAGPFDGTGSTATGSPPAGQDVSSTAPSPT
jgi:hypothetical protein